MIEKFFVEQEDADIMKGIVAGVAGGLLASLVMEQFQFLWSKASEAINRGRETEKPKGRKADPSTVKVAQSISKGVFGKKLPKSKKRLAAEAVHYAMGAASGAIYGAAAEVLPSLTIGDGLVFGTAVWVLADEVTVPALQLSKPPTKYPASTHVYALASHLVYGWTTELVRRAVRKML
jgi:putative membrane protein